MPPEHEALLILTRMRFPGLEAAHCEIDAIIKGGSDRRFFRLRFPHGEHDGMVLMVYTLARRDNPKFVPATRRLAAHGVHVPSIYAFDEDMLCVWLEDLGGDDLFAHQDDAWPQRKALYEATLREIAKVHSIDAKGLTKADLAELEPPFDEALYLWEQDYFLTHYLEGVRNRRRNDAAFIEAHEALEELRKRLAKEPRCLVHRDFQSQNVLLRDGEALFVDYQGLRPGLAEYDLASLLLDPYVRFTEHERDELLASYAEHCGEELVSMRERFHLCAAQRLMQALGAYGNLSRNLGKPAFKQHIPAAEANLRHVCEQHPMLQPLVALLSD
jgi:hypothetical protein